MSFSIPIDEIKQPAIQEGKVYGKFRIPEALSLECLNYVNNRAKEIGSPELLNGENFYDNKRKILRGFNFFQIVIANEFFQNVGYRTLGIREALELDWAQELSRGFSRDLGIVIKDFSSESLSEQMGQNRVIYNSGFRNLLKTKLNDCELPVILHPACFIVNRTKKSSFRLDYSSDFFPPIQGDEAEILSSKLEYDERCGGCLRLMRSAEGRYGYVWKGEENLLSSSISRSTIDWIYGKVGCFN